MLILFIFVRISVLLARAAQLESSGSRHCFDRIVVIDASLPKQHPEYSSHFNELKIVEEINDMLT